MGDGKGNTAIEMIVYEWVMERVIQQLIEMRVCTWVMGRVIQ